MDDMNWGNQPPHNSYRSYGPTDATQPVPPIPAPEGGQRQRRRRALRWTAGVAAALVLAGGGVLAGLDLSSSPAPDGQATLLSSALNGTSSPSTGASASPGAATGARARNVAGILRHLRGLHGEFTVRAKDGTFRELAFERGIVVAASGKNVTVRAADGTTWAWTFVTDTIVRKDGARSTTASLATGDPVFVGGPQYGAVRDARLIIIPKKRAAGSPGASTPAPSSS